ncbi:MAG: multiheme c-type cytochrome, partial [Polyangiaceae bacterium]
AAGPLFYMDPVLSGERADQDRAKADTIARVLGGLDLVAFAPGANDWANGRGGLITLARDAGATALLPDATGGAPFARVLVRDAGGLNVGFVGYGISEGAGRASGAAAEEAVRRGVEEAKKQGANVLVALVSVGRGEAKRIADAVPELTAVVVGSARANGDTNTIAPEGERVGDVLIAQASNHLQSVAVLDLYVRDPTVPGRVLRFADATGLDRSERREDLDRRIDDLHRRISAWQRDGETNQADLSARRRDLAQLESDREALDHQKPPPPKGSFLRYALKEVRESMGSDPAIEQSMARYYQSINDHNRIALAHRLPPPLGPSDAAYVGINVCSSCHPGARRVWDKTKHAHAYATLSVQFKEYNLECVSCHVTGYGKPGGSTVTHVDSLENVQCEVCHGPGGKHVENPTDPTRIIASPQAAQCLECHHPPHVEGFDAVAKMKEILGPGHGLPGGA